MSSPYSNARALVSRKGLRTSTPGLPRPVMAATYWEETVYAVPPLAALQRCDDSRIFTWVGDHLPITGSKIDWDRVTGPHSHWGIDDADDFVALVVREVGSRIGSAVGALHAGDGLSPYGVCVVADGVKDTIVALLQVPEHHYFLAEDHSWLAVVTTEGDFDLAEIAAIDASR